MSGMSYDVEVEMFTRKELRNADGAMYRKMYYLMDNAVIFCEVCREYRTVISFEGMYINNGKIMCDDCYDDMEGA